MNPKVLILLGIVVVSGCGEREATPEAQEEDQAAARPSVTPVENSPVAPKPETREEKFAREMAVKKAKELEVATVQLENVEELEPAEAISVLYDFYAAKFHNLEDRILPELSDGDRLIRLWIKSTEWRNTSITSNGFEIRHGLGYRDPEFRKRAINFVAENITPENGERFFALMPENRSVAKAVLDHHPRVFMETLLATPTGSSSGVGGVLLEGVRDEKLLWPDLQVLFASENPEIQKLGIRALLRLKPHPPEDCIPFLETCVDSDPTEEGLGRFARPSLWSAYYGRLVVRLEDETLSANRRALYVALRDTLTIEENSPDDESPLNLYLQTIPEINRNSPSLMSEIALIGRRIDRPYPWVVDAFLQLPGEGGEEMASTFIIGRSMHGDPALLFRCLARVLPRDAEQGRRLFQRVLAVQRLDWPQVPEKRNFDHYFSDLDRPSNPWARELLEELLPDLDPIGVTSLKKIINKLYPPPEGSAVTEEPIGEEPKTELKPPALRIWRSDDGKAITGTFVEFKNGKVHIKPDVPGKPNYQIPLSSFSKNDQYYVQQRE